MRLRLRSLTAGALVFIGAACAGGGGAPSFTSLYITAEDLEGTGVESAYDVLAHHRELLVFGSRIAFRGGNDLQGENERYFEPLLIVDGNRDVGDVTTALRRIPAEDISSIRLVFASELGPEDRRPEASGGVIEITTRHSVRRSF